jgi:hypothetical protein
MVYQSIKKAKEDMIKKDYFTEMDQVREAKGMDGLAEYSKNLADEVNKASKAAKEFPDDEGVVLDFKAMKTKIDLIE